jgi:Uma2 family endonuclease
MTDMEAVIENTAPQTAEIDISRLYRLTVEQYHQMVESGMLASGDPIELLEGWLTLKMTKKPAHRIVTQDLRDLLPPLMPKGYFVDDQEPVTTEDSEPEPDLLVIRGKRSDYANRHPLAKEVALVVEVSDVTLRTDRTIKQRIYAKARIPIYWLLNLNARTLEVYTQPIGEGMDAKYSVRVDYTAAQSVPLMLDGREIAQIQLADLLP